MIESPVFSPCFLIEFRKFFHQLNIHTFFLSLPLGLKGLFPLSNKAMISNAYIHSSELASKRISNCNIMKSYNQSCDRPNLIGIISDYY